MALGLLRPSPKPLMKFWIMLTPNSFRKLLTGRPQDRRKISLVTTLFFLVVVAPTLLTFGYAMISRTPFFMSQVQFAIEDRSQPTFQGPSGAMASIGFVSGEPNSMYSLRRFLQSWDALAELEHGYGFKRHYTPDHGDWLTALDADADPDETMKYYQRVVTPHISTTENILTLEVWAYDPQVAQDIARSLLKISENFLNRMNARSLEDQVAFYKDELASANKHLALSRAALTTWRNKNNALDPMVQAQMIQGLISGLEAELSDVRADITQLLNSSNPERFQPKIKVLQERERSLLSQISDSRNRLTGPSDGTVAVQIAAYEELNANVELAQTSVTMLIGSLETARQAVLQKQKYLLLIASPSLNHERVFPLAGFHTLVVCVAALLIFGVMVLLHMIVRDYRNV